MIRIVLLMFMVLASPLHADTETEITTALDYFAEVWNEGDLESIRSYYHPDFVLITDNGVMTLGQRMGDLETIVKAGEDQGDLSHSQIKVRILGEQYAVAYGLRNLKFKDGSGFDIWFTTVYLKTPFGWKAILTNN